MEVKKNTSEEDLLKDLFPDLDNSEDEEPEEDEVIIIFLWEEHKGIFDVYKILRNYISPDYELDSALLLALLTDNDLPITKSIKLLSFIHGSYVNTIIPPSTGEKNG